MDMEKLPTSVRALIPFASWFDRHPVLMNVILWIEAIALLYAVLMYDFTTNL